MKKDFFGLRTTIYRVDNISKAKKWYAGVFGVDPYFDEPFYVGFTIGGFELGLQPDESSSSKKSDNVLSYWGVENVEKVYQKLLKAGASPHEAPQNVGGDIVVASVRDPWQNVIGIIYNPEFKISS
jgi:predicted enzyme related to lactoylglutathione lyase